MFNVNEILNGPKKGKKKSKSKSSLFDMDRMFPKMKTDIGLPKEIQSEIKDTPKEKIIVHNHYYQMPPMQQMPPMKFKQKKRKFSLSTFNGEKPFNDDDNDGYPNYMDPQPQNPEQPKKKKMIWEKTLRSIYRDDKDD